MSKHSCPRCQNSAGPHCTNKGCTWVICGRCVAVVRPDGKGYPR